MVLNKLLSMIYHFISLKGQPRIKGASHASCEVIDPLAERKLEGSLAESTAESSAGEGEFCCVCLSRLKEEEEETSLLPCMHRFHKACIEKWFSVCKKTCPICRFSMEEEKFNYVGEVLTEEMVIYFSSFHAAGFWIVLRSYYFFCSLFTIKILLPILWWNCIWIETIFPQKFSAFFVVLLQEKVRLENWTVVDGWKTNTI